MSIAPEFTLWEHQEKGVEAGMELIHPMYLMEMRTGKTRTTIAWMLETVKLLKMKSYRAIVITESNAVEPWVRDLTLANIPFVLAVGLSKEKRSDAIIEAWKEKKVLIMNYHGLLVFPEISTLAYDFCILDEVTNIKNPKAQMSKICTEYQIIKYDENKKSKRIKTGFRQTKYRAALTGLLSPESYFEVFTPMKFLHGAFMGQTSFYAWRDKFATKDQITGGYFFTPSQEEKIKKAILDKSYQVRRKDLNIPEHRTYEKWYTEHNHLQKEAARQIFEEFRFCIKFEGNTYTNETDSVLVRNLWLQQLDGGFIPGTDVCINREPIELLIENLKGELKKSSVVVWCRFKEEWKFIIKELRNAGILVSGISGDVSDTQQKLKLNKAFRDKVFDVIVCTIASSEKGVDFSNALMSVYYSNEWSGEMRAQSEDRLVHLERPSGIYPFADIVVREGVSDTISDIVTAKTKEAKERQNKYFPLEKIREAFNQRISSH